MRTVIGIIRLSLYALLCITLIPVQACILLISKGPAAFLIPVYFHKIVCSLFALKVEVVGAPAADRRIVFLSNHLSYLDIEVIGSVIGGAFVAKKEVASWPLFGLLAKLQQTTFISRDPRAAEEGKSKLDFALTKPTPLVLFAEGTSSNGTQVFPFKSTLFEMLLNKNIILQPLTIDLIAIEGCALTDPKQRDQYAYYGDSVLAPHLWAFAKSRGARIRLVFHPPLDVKHHPDRKSLATAAHTACTSGLGLLCKSQTAA